MRFDVIVFWAMVQLGVLAVKLFSGGDIGLWTFWPAMIIAIYVVLGLIAAATHQLPYRD